jgi:acetyl-CoA C-acetyltransferase
MTFVSASIGPRTPCLVGVAQQAVRPGDGPAPEPLDSWEQVTRAAAGDAGAPRLVQRLDSVQVVYCQSWPYDDPAGRLSDRLGAAPAHRTYSGIGGTVGQRLLAGAAGAIARGELDSALVVGAEALATKRALKKSGQRPAWSHRDPQRKPFPLETMPHPSEIAHEVFPAYLTFALFDVARRAARGDSLAEERAGRGAMMAPMTRVAAANPHAWFPVERSPDELVTPSPDNRLVASPYTKWTVAVMDVDMAAAAILMSTQAADALGVPPDKRIYLRGHAYAEDPAFVAERADLSSSAAMRAASAEALRVAGAGLDDIAHVDLYSCFASSLRFGCDALGLDPLDPRGLTVTGGLPFAGGPASNYLLHGLASMAERLRADPGAYGLLSGVGMHLQKHGYSLWSSEPGPLGEPDTELIDKRLAGETRCALAEAYDGPARVASYSVIHGRDGAASSGVLMLDLPEGPLGADPTAPSGARGWARVTEPELLADAESRELVGQPVTVTTNGQVNTAAW